VGHFGGNLPKNLRDYALKKKKKKKKETSAAKHVKSK